MNRTSTRRAAQLREYAKVRPVFLEANPFCFKCNDTIAPKYREVHHFYGRVGALLIWVPGFRCACRACHSWIEQHRNDAVKLNLRAPDNLWNRPSKVIPR